MNRRILQAKMDEIGARKAIKDAEREAQREKRTPPAFLMDKLNEALAMARRNLRSAEAADYAMHRFPPVAR